MRNYRPDYVSIKEYQRLLNENKARQALVQAAQMSWITPMEQPTLGVSQGERRGPGQPAVAGPAGRGRAGTEDQSACTKRFRRARKTARG